MPSTYAHYRFGREVFQALPEALRDAVTPHIDLYHMGLHGPDLLFYYEPYHRCGPNELGSAIHAAAARDFFSAAASLLAGQGFPPAGMAYLYGVICHFALDRECHGYVGEKEAQSGVTHGEIEGEFDRFLLEKDGYDPVRKRLTDHIRPSRETAEVIAPFFPPVTVEETYKAERSYLFYSDLLLAPGYLKRGGISLLLKLAGQYDNIKGMIINRRANPLCADSNDTLFRLYTQAKDRAVALMCAWQATAAGETPWDGLYGYNFNGQYVGGAREEKA